MSAAICPTALVMAERVSVIIPCYKDSLTLGRALDSVLAQTLRVFEVIVVNDCSPETPAIEAVLNAYPKVIYVKNSRNLGLAATRNAGVRSAAGEIVTFLDADDELHPQKIEAQLSLYRPGLAISCRVGRIGDVVGIADAIRYPKEVPYSTFTRSESIIRRNCLTGASLMISRELFLALGGYDEALRSCEDFDLWLRILDADITVLDIEFPLYLYRINEMGLSRNHLNISIWELEVVKKYFSRHRPAKLSPMHEAATLAFWLIKHLIRYEHCRDKRLLASTLRNLDLLSPWPLVRALILIFHSLGILRAIARVRR